MSTAKVNPVHFKPTWFFVRMPDEADEIQEAFGDGCLALRDADMIAIKVALATFIRMGNGDGDPRIKKMCAVIQNVLDKLAAVMAIEFGDTDE